MVKAIARAFRWRELLENGTHATIAEIAAAEKINASYVGRVLRLTLLAPGVVEAIRGGRQPTDLQLEDLLRRCAVDWRCGSAHDSGHLVGEACLAVYSFGPRYDDCAGICGASGAVVWDPPATAGSLSLNLLGCSSPVASRTG
jgi:hypothetical protein